MRYSRQLIVLCISALGAAVEAAGAQTDEPAEIASSDAMLPGGVSFDFNEVKALAETHAAVAIVLLMFHPDFIEGNTSMQRGAVAFPGMPTAKTFELARKRADRKAIEASFEALLPERFVQVRWAAIAVEDDVLKVTFRSEIIDESVKIHGVVASPVVVSISRSQHKVLSIEIQRDPAAMG